MINNPGSKAYYCSGGVAVVEDGLAQRTPCTCSFRISRKPISSHPWESDRAVVDLELHPDRLRDKEYSQIHLRPRDMLKLGIVFTSAVIGKVQVVFSSWVKA